MKKLYFIYWKSKRVNGNTVIDIDWKKENLDDVINKIIFSINKNEDGFKIENLEISFLVELK
ncbi:hypothetical protein LCGC14_0477810 [marine sediment metagenome]|uniref:Uncharacterized protein n=1 Tax=marine sediment metagenome TaxID=412755 RepID=A0A0F9SAD4_9ZZZZ